MQPHLTQAHHQQIAALKKSLLKFAEILEFFEAALRARFEEGFEKRTKVAEKVRQKFQGAEVAPLL